MWSISDLHAPTIANDVYTHLFKDRKPNSTEAAEALHYSVKKLQGKPGISCFDWVPFIHMGLWVFGVLVHTVLLPSSIIYELCWIMIQQQIVSHQFFKFLLDCVHNHLNQIIFSIRLFFIVSLELIETFAWHCTCDWVCRSSLPMNHIRKKTFPMIAFRWNTLLHFCPLSLQLCFLNILFLPCMIHFYLLFLVDSESSQVWFPFLY